MLPKIDVADGIVCSSVPKAGPAGWYRWSRGAVLWAVKRKEDDLEKGGGSVGTDGMTLVLTQTIILIGVSRFLTRPLWIICI